MFRNTSILWQGRARREERSRRRIEDLVEETPDGILVTGGEATRNHAATGTVRVTMNAQREDPILLDKLREFRVVGENAWL